MGKPSAGIEVGVIDHEGSELPPNKEGDIAVKIKPLRPTWMFSEFVDALPKTISGKIRRVELREMERKKKLGKE